MLDSTSGSRSRLHPFRGYNIDFTLTCCHPSSHGPNMTSWWCHVDITSTSNRGVYAYYQEHSRPEAYRHQVTRGLGFTSQYHTYIQNTLMTHIQCGEAHELLLCTSNSSPSSIMGIFPLNHDSDITFDYLVTHSDSFPFYRVITNSNGDVCEIQFLSEMTWIVMYTIPCRTMKDDDNKRPTFTRIF